MAQHNMNGMAVHSQPRDSLNITIVGAGIGGLMAAIGLAKNGNTVNIYESSEFANETGAAIHLAPNANGVLRRFGIIPEALGAVEVIHMSQFNEKHEKQSSMSLIGPAKMWQHPWQLIHRVNLHTALKESAKSAGAVLHTSRKAITVDPENATVVFESGETIKADLVIGADGIYSTTRAALPGPAPNLFSSGKAAFRFLVPRTTLEEDPITASLIERKGELVMWFGSDRRIVMYPCDNDTLLNFVCIHPESESQGSGSEWSKQASLEQLLKVYSGFDPAIIHLLSKADPKVLKVWKLLDMDVLPSWTVGNLVLLGDAAHPFLPHQGQGGGVAMEDAATLSVVLPAGTPVESIPERLKLYEQIRQTRANSIQEFSRLAGKDWVNGKPAIDMMSYTIYNFGHDEIDNSTKVFNDWKRAKNPNLYHRMPTVFGAFPGPRQDINSSPRRSPDQKFLTASIKFKTSATFLRNLFPTEKFSFASPGTVCYASFSLTTLSNMTWLGGHGYNLFGLYIYGVKYTKKDGSVIVGTYLPILFENLADPIVSGREELGMPKLFCDIDIEPRSDSSYRMSCSWKGCKFVDFAIENLESADVASKISTPGEKDSGILAYKYVPAVGEPGKADVEYPVFVPHDEEAKLGTSVTTSVERSAKGIISIKPHDWKSLPTLHHVVSALAQIPIYEVVDAELVGGTGVPDVSSARRVE